MKKDKTKKENDNTKSTGDTYGFYSVYDIYWSDLTRQKQQELLEAGFNESYIIDDTIPLGEVDSYYIKDEYSDEYYDYNYNYEPKYKYQYPATTDYSKFSIADRYNDDHLELEDLTKLARKVYWLLLKYMPEDMDLPSDMYVGDIIEYLENFYGAEELQMLLDVNDTTELKRLADDIYEMFFKVDIN